MAKDKQRFSGAICGGNRKYAQQLVEKNGHCKKHKKFKEGCEKCMDKKIELIDAYFMALM
jgi:undecaprenyl pyrophosphate synthase